MSKNHCFESLALSDLTMVIGGETSGKISVLGNDGEFTYKPEPSPPPAAPDPDKQQRCYKQFSDQAHWYDSSNTTFNHQMLACGPLRP